MPDDLNYERDVKIDPNRLEQCLVEQAELYAKWTTEWAKATKEKDKAKDKLGIVRSKLEKQARANWC